ncbi:hypothetical protein ACK3SF_01330 [Candidatus Nanosalina sp. VS9-1]|uniref:hypothetical protein n=1 Tax=Candidatus Nanosalina sp. VS9-1 TaxID=3388566 RepID=UPI0039DF5616
MKLDKSIAVLAMVASLILAAGAAAAQDNTPAGTTIDEGQTLDEYFNSQEQSVDLDGGNVTAANLSAEQSTDSWAGLYGNATGSLVLGTGDSGSVLYNWDASAENVFASSASVTWTNLTNGTAEDVDSYYSFLSGSDNAVNTFTSGNTTITLDGEDYKGETAMTNNDAGSGAWSTVALLDNSSEKNPVFTGIVGEDATAFNGDSADYQLILPAEDDSVNSFNMYLELG